MPTYQYRCDACKEEFEREQRITEDPIKTCPSCGKRKARRMIGASTFILKGGGWESDLYSGRSNRKASATKPSSTGTDSTPASSTAPSKSDSATKTPAAAE
ncbi:MAG: zinc ribbon domain-containing protein [Myxococcales bacterium]|nr:zinc ribbon domain-containing protein [Myxococcales bacterium]